LITLAVSFSYLKSESEKVILQSFWGGKSQGIDSELLLQVSHPFALLIHFTPSIPDNNTKHCTSQTKAQELTLCMLICWFFNRSVQCDATIYFSNCTSLVCVESFSKSCSLVPTHEFNLNHKILSQSLISLIGEVS